MKKIIVLFAALLLSVSLMGQDDKLWHVGVDTTVDCFLGGDGTFKSSYGLGVRSRLGNCDQRFNLIGELRFIYGERLQGFQVPIMVNLNLIKGVQAAGYVGAGFEFDFIGTYLGCMKIQTGLTGKHFDLRVFYKPYQEDLGVGITYYF